MATRADPLSPAAFGIDAVGVLTRRVSPGQGLIREQTVSLARVRFGEPKEAANAPPKRPPKRVRLKPGADHSRRYKSE